LYVAGIKIINTAWDFKEQNMYWLLRFIGTIILKIGGFINRIGRTTSKVGSQIHCRGSINMVTISDCFNNTGPSAAVKAANRIVRGSCGMAYGAFRRHDCPKIEGSMDK